MLRSFMLLAGLAKRVLWAAVMTSVLSCSVFGQTYTIKTAAGGGLPVNIPGTSSSLGRIDGIATDGSGNVFMTVPDYAIVLRWDAATGLVTLVAGNGNVQGPASGDNGPATSAQLNNPSGIAVDSGGNIYITDGGNRIRKVSSGVVTTVAGGGTVSSGDNGPATSAQLNNAAGIAVDAAGSLYIAAGNRIRKISNGVITTVAGNGTAGFSGDSGPAASAQLNNPSGIAVDSGGAVYVADANNNVVRRVVNGVITTIAGNGTAGFSGDNGPANGAQLYSPYGIAVDASGSLYITDRGNNRIRKVSNGTITTVAGGAVQSSSPPDASCAPYPAGFVPFTSVSSLSFPNSAGDQLLQGSLLQANASDPLANFKAMNNLPLPAVPDQKFCGSVQLAAGYSVQAYVPTAAERNGDFRGFAEPLIDPISGFPMPGNLIPLSRLPSVYAWRIRVDSGDDGPATTSLLNIPCGIAIDPAGLLYVADYGDYRIRKVSNGVITTVAGNGMCCFTGDGGAATAARLGYPAGSPAGLAVDSAGSLYILGSPAGSLSIGGGGVREVSKGVITTVVAGQPYWLGNSSAIAIDSSGNLYIADMYGYRIRKVSNGVITTVEGKLKEDFSSDNDPFVTAVAVDSAGNLYIADSGANRVLKLSDGVITTVAGDGTFGFSGDGGPATSAQLKRPVSLAVDSTDGLYIADSDNYRIRKVLNGVITTVAGDGTRGFGGDNGPATSAQFDSLSSIAIDPLGNLFIADRNNPRIRKVSNGVITTIAGNGIVGFAGDNGPASDAELGHPRDVAVDSTGKVYISDTAINRIRVLTPSGSSGSASVSPTSFCPTASGGDLTSAVQTSTSRAWAVQSLPNWITYAGRAVGAGPARAGNNEWTSVGPDGGFVYALAVDPQNPGTVYASTLSNVYRSTDGAVSWAKTGFTGHANGLVIDPRNSGTVYAPTPSGVSKSTDGGASWSAASSGLQGGPVLLLIIDPRNSSTLYAMTSFAVAPEPLPVAPMMFRPTVFKTTDGGNTWNAASSGLAPGNYALTVAIDPRNPSTLYASTASAPFQRNAGTGLLRSIDGGASWSAAGAGIPDYVSSLAIDPQDSKIIYAVSSAPGVGGIVRSTDGGTTWTDQGSDLPGALTLAIDPRNPATLYAVTGGDPSRPSTGLFKSTNGGTNWNAALAGQVISFALDPQNPATLYAAATPREVRVNGSGVFKTTDGGGSWNAANSGIREIPVQNVAIDPQHAGTLYAANGGKVLKTSDGGVHWIAGDIDVWKLAIDPRDPGTVFALVSSGQLAKSTDGGASWSRLPVASNYAVTNLAIDPQNSGVVYAGTTAKGVLKSTDGGANWSPANSGLPEGGVSVLAISGPEPTTVYASTVTDCDCGDLGDGIFKSTDSGSSWIAINSGLPGGSVAHGRSASSIAVDPKNPATLYIGLWWSEANNTYRSGLFKSIDGGTSWKQLSSGLAEESYFGPLAMDPRDPGTVYVGTESGVLRSTDGGENWSAVNAGLPKLPIRSLAIDPQGPNSVYAGTDAGLFVITIAVE